MVIIDRYVLGLVFFIDIYYEFTIIIINRYLS